MSKNSKKEISYNIKRIQKDWVLLYMQGVVQQQKKHARQGHHLNKPSHSPVSLTFVLRVDPNITFDGGTTISFGDLLDSATMRARSHGWSCLQTELVLR
jgi:hypothetical protein